MRQQYINTWFFGEEINSNSRPIKFTCAGGVVYYVKIAHSKTDFDDLIYESLAVHLAKHFNIPVPDFDFINIVPQSYDINRILNANNKLFIPLNNIGFGSKDIEHHEILGPQNDKINNKHEFNKILNPLDFIKIGIFDFHVNNTDRTGDNYNIIFDSNYNKNKRKFVAIDHVAIFGGTLLKNRFTPRCTDNLGKNILNCAYGEKIISYLKKSSGDVIFKSIIGDYFAKIDEIPLVVNEFFETIPVEWRYNEELPNRIIAYLINEERNVYLQSELRNLLKISS